MSKENIIDFYLNVRKKTESLCKPLAIEDYVPQPVEFASPPKWHLAHTSWFFEEMILKQNPTYKEFHPEFSFLFNSYYNFVGKRTIRANRGNMTRPTVDVIYEYRQYVDQHMNELMANNESLNQFFDLIELGCNHEQQHQELLITDLKYTLGHNPLFPVYSKDFEESIRKSADKAWIKMDEGIYTIGHQRDGFCYDNELGVHKVYLHEYLISKELVTNEEYLEFIKDNGYQRFDLWLDEGWSWIQNNKIDSPLYWHNIKGEWNRYNLSGLEQIQKNESVTHLSYYEANAFATWKGMRLATEFEWEAASHHFDWGERWEWTNSAYLPYPDFKIGEGAVGEYNGKFMINQMVLRGSSVATSEGHSRKTYRNFFHPHHQWQFSGIRLVQL